MKANKIFNVLVVLALLLAAVPMMKAGAAGTPVVSPGYDPAAAMFGAVRYRSFNSGTGGEVYLGLPNLGTGGNRVEIDFYGSADCNGTPGYGAWTASNHVKFIYNAGTGKIRTEVQASRYYCKEYAIAPVVSANYIKLDVVNRASGTTVNFNNVTLNGMPVGDFTGAGWKTWSITGVDLTSGFTLESDIILAGSQPGGETNKVEIGFGYSVPPDNEGPVTSNVDVTPAYLNGPATVTALVDDTTTGGSTIASAEYRLNGGAWTPMSTSDGAFDEVAEDVTADFTAAQIGENSACVRGTDALGNLGAETCQTFVVAYVFDGFFQPINNTEVNNAKSGQAIPAKWRLTDTLGAPVSDPTSFVGLYSYPVSCTDFTGDPVDAIEEYASGSSGLQYQGDGYWQFNWKTLKSYAGTCRAMYGEFLGGSTSPIVFFQFK